MESADVKKMCLRVFGHEETAQEKIEKSNNSLDNRYFLYKQNETDGYIKISDTNCTYDLMTALGKSRAIFHEFDS